MQKKDSSLDHFVYILMCILSLGAVWLTRIVITHAIRCALKDE